MMWTILAALLLTWMFAAIFENGASAAGLLILALTVWALIDYA